MNLSRDIDRIRTVGKYDILGWIGIFYRDRPTAKKRLRTPTNIRMNTRDVWKWWLMNLMLEKRRSSDGKHAFIRENDDMQNLTKNENEEK